MCMTNIRHTDQRSKILLPACTIRNQLFPRLACCLHPCISLVGRRKGSAAFCTGYSSFAPARLTMRFEKDVRTDECHPESCILIEATRSQGLCPLTPPFHSLSRDEEDQDRILGPILSPLNKQRETRPRNLKCRCQEGREALAAKRTKGNIMPRSGLRHSWSHRFIHYIQPSLHYSCAGRWR